MPPELIAEERHQFYLYDLLRLLPGRRPVTIYFAADGPIVRMVTTFATSTAAPGDAQEIRLSGRTTAEGLSWFRTMSISRGDKSSFDMTLTRFRPLPGMEDSLLRGPPR